MEVLFDDHLFPELPRELNDLVLKYYGKTRCEIHNYRILKQRAENYFEKSLIEQKKRRKKLLKYRNDETPVKLVIIQKKSVYGSTSDEDINNFRKLVIDAPTFSSFESSIHANGMNSTDIKSRGFNESSIYARGINSTDEKYGNAKVVSFDEFCKHQIDIDEDEACFALSTSLFSHVSNGIDSRGYYMYQKELSVSFCKCPDRWYYSSREDRSFVDNLSVYCTNFLTLFVIAKKWCANLLRDRWIDSIRNAIRIKDLWLKYTIDSPQDGGRKTQHIIYRDDIINQSILKFTIPSKKICQAYSDLYHDDLKVYLDFFGRLGMPSPCFCENGEFNYRHGSWASMYDELHTNRSSLVSMRDIDCDDDDEFPNENNMSDSGSTIWMRVCL